MDNKQITLSINIPPDFFDHLTNSIRQVVREEIAAIHNGSNGNDATSEYLTRGETAKLLSITLPTIDSWIKSGRLTGYRLGRKVRLKANEVDAALAKINIGNNKPLKVSGQKTQTKGLVAEPKDCDQVEVDQNEGNPLDWI
jgi:excisionase family DNA binding protein